MALPFTGDGTYAQKSITFSQNKGTVILHFILTADTNAEGAIVQLCNGDDAQVEVFVTTDGETLRCYTYPSGVSGTKLSINRWYSLGVTWDGSDTKVYLDGVLDITNPNDGANWSEIRLGSDWWGTTFTGAIANVLAWDSVFTAKQIRSQLKRMTPITFANIKLWLPTFPDTRLTDSAGSSLTDSDGTALYDNSESLRDYSGYGNDLTRYGPGEFVRYRNPPIAWGGKPGVIPRNNLPKTYDGTLSLGAGSGYASGSLPRYTMPITLNASSALAPSARVNYTRAIILASGAGLASSNTMRTDAALTLPVYMTLAAGGVRNVFDNTVLALQAEILPGIGDLYDETIQLVANVGFAVSSLASLQAVVDLAAALAHTTASIAAYNAGMQLQVYPAVAAAPHLQLSEAIALALVTTLTGSVGGVVYNAALVLHNLQTLDLGNQLAAGNSIDLDLAVTLAARSAQSFSDTLTLPVTAAQDLANTTQRHAALTLSAQLFLSGDTRLDAGEALSLASYLGAELASQLAAQATLSLAQIQQVVAAATAAVFVQITDQLLAGYGCSSAAYSVNVDVNDCRELTLEAEIRSVTLAPEARTVVMLPEHRSVTIPTESRVVIMPIEMRTVEVPC